jgi:hypothetical protein
MFRNLLTPLLLAATASTLAQNTCPTAIVITAGTYTIDAINGTEVPDPICADNGPGATAGEWYRYTPTQNWTVILTTDLPQNTGLDPRFHVYTGTCGNLVCHAGDDDGGSGYLAVATFNVSAGVTYTIAFDNRWSSAGFDFQLIEAPVVPASISFTNQSINTSGSALGAVDMNNDGLDDVVSVTATNIRIHYQQPGGGFQMVNFPTTQADNTPSWSMAAGDIDGNGHLDLLYGGGSGVTFMMASNDGTAFTEVSFPQYVFSQRSNFVDINSDGHLDAFVCHDVQPNVYYINDGNGTLNFYQGGLGDTPDGGNYGSIWIDYDNDCDIDLFIAKCRGGNTPANINQMHRNNGDGTYTEVGAQIGLADAIQTWSSAWGDFDNDGDMDVLVGASSYSNGGHKLMRNNGDGTFTDITQGSGFDLLPTSSTSIEHCAHDFNNDGWIDVKGGGFGIMVNNGNMTFTPQAVSAGDGPVGDLNNDGTLDVLNGSTIRMGVPNGNNWLKVRLQGMVSNKNGIGARVGVVSPSFNQSRDVKAGDGFRYMSSITAHFGLGGDTQVQTVLVCWPSGILDVIHDVPVNSTLTVVEGLSTGVTAREPDATLMLHPNPAGDEVFVSGPFAVNGRAVRITELGGRTVLETTLQDGRVNIAGLAAGNYLFQLHNGVQFEGRKLVKR